jgi:uncharacterized DUF497 family protein
MRFEWDERKRLANLAKHGLDFRRAVQVFARPSFSYPSPRQDMAIRYCPRDLHEEGEA